MNILLCLEKSSDLLEAYSYLRTTASKRLDVAFLQVEGKNDASSVRAFLEGAGLRYDALNLLPQSSHSALFQTLTERSAMLTHGDALVAPFIRYRDIWQQIAVQRRGVTTVHLSETIPDSFGHLGYRVAFRGKSFKSWLTAPLAALYSLKNKPDICYFPLMPQIANPFVRMSLPVEIPPLVEEKAQLLKLLLGSVNRSLIVGGFGYDAIRMADSLSESSYIATSKHKEIVVDGARVPLPFHISAEEVMLATRPRRLISYTSTVTVWAKRIHPDMPIHCYRSSAMADLYGILFTAFAEKSLNRVGITVLPEQKEMLQRA